MALVTANFNIRVAPEVNPADTDSIRKNYLRVMLLRLPGFLVKQVSTKPETAHALLQNALEGIVLLGDRKQQFHFPHGPDDKPDRGFHIDLSGVPERLQVNETTVQSGSMEVDLFSLLEPFATDRLNGSTDGEVDDDEAIYYEEDSSVNDVYIDPNGYRFEVTEGDLLVFSDSQSPHSFKTRQSPRRSMAELYCPSLLLPMNEIVSTYL